MTATSVEAALDSITDRGPTGSVAHTFGAVLWRDTFVTGREIGTFLAQVVIQPFFTLFIFGKVLGDLGYVGAEFEQVLLPGVVALTGYLTALQNTMLPMVVEFSWTREIEDRLLAPMPIRLLALEKILFGAIRGTIAAVLMVPVGFIVLDNVHWPPSMLLIVLGLVLLGSLAGATIGMTVGTLVPPERINIMLTVLLLPLMFTGSTQFPWLSLHELRWFQVICALNPLTYVSEGVRAVVMPATVKSVPLWLDIPLILLGCVIFGVTGVAGFVRRSRD
jgi:ABC-2 type transport system permease protein